jgi:hypothetical protein
VLVTYGAFDDQVLLLDVKFKEMTMADIVSEL